MKAFVAVMRHTAPHGFRMISCGDPSQPCQLYWLYATSQGPEGTANLRVPQTCPGPMHHISPRASSPCTSEDTARLGSSSPQPCPTQPCSPPSWAHQQAHSPAWLHPSVVLRKVPGSAQVPLVARSWLRWWDRTLRASEPSIGSP